MIHKLFGLKKKKKRSTTYIFQFYLEACFSGEDGEGAEVDSCVSAAALLQLQLSSLETGSGLASVEFNHTLVAYRQVKTKKKPSTISSGIFLSR